jgi:serine/threonine protein kinase
MHSAHSHSEMKPQPGGISQRTQPLAIMPDGNRPLALGSGIITSILGEGGAAVVYEIWVEKLGLKRAVKVLKPNTQGELSTLFETEMKLTAQLRHPNIVEIHTVGIWENLPYIEMEKIDGPSLRELLFQHRDLPLEVCTAIGIVICKVLEFAHTHEFMLNGTKQRGILHHDLKPENIMLTHKGNLKLMDFGIATPTDMNGNVIPGKVVGSLQYLSPEVLQGKNTDKRSDIFSFGCILYNCITGVKAFPESRMPELVAQRCSNRYDPVHTLKRGVPKRLRALIDRCLKTDPDDRYPDTGTIAKALEKIHRKLTHLSAAETLIVFMRAPLENQVNRFRKKRKLRLASAVMLPLLLGAASAIVYYYLSSKYMAPPLPAAAAVVVTHPEPAILSPFPIPPAIAAQPESAPAEITVEPSPSRVSSLSLKKTPLRRPSLPETNAAIQMKNPPAPLAISPLRAYSTTDPLLALKLAASAQKYNDILSIYETLTPEQASHTSSIIFRLRALLALKYIRAAVRAVGLAPIEDAEFYLLKARVLHANNDYRGALAALGRCSSLPAECIDRESVARESQYYSALCLTALFEDDRTDANRQKALECWFNVKYAYRAFQDDNRFVNANAYIRQLSEQK